MKIKVFFTDGKIQEFEGDPNHLSSGVVEIIEKVEAQQSGPIYSVSTSQKITGIPLAKIEKYELETDAE